MKRKTGEKIKFEMEIR